MKNYQRRVKKLEDIPIKQAAATDSDDAGNELEVLRRAAKEGGDIHAKARLEVFEKLLTVLGPSFEAAEAIASTVPAELESGMARRRAWQKEIYRRDFHNYQVFSEFWLSEMTYPDDGDPEEFFRRPFADSYASRIVSAETESRARNEPDMSQEGTK
jgi:hypothetical protein